MPTQIMDQRHASASTHHYEDIFSSAERHVGFWKPNSTPSNQGTDEMMSANANKFAGPVSPEQLSSIDLVDNSRLSSIDLGEEEGFPNFPRNSRAFTNPQSNTWSNLYLQSAAHGVEGATDVRGIGCESSLFSSSLSELYNRKLRLSRNDLLPLEPRNRVSSENEEVEPFESLEEIEAQTIGNLLPDEDDLFSGVIGEARVNSRGSSGDDLEDFDLFSSGGGLELEGDEQRRYKASNGNIGDHPPSRHSSRTLVVRNIDGNIEDFELKALFEQFGGIQALYTACKLRGFVIVSYYDIRAAQNALRTLQWKRLGQHNLDIIHYSSRKENLSEEDINQATLAVSNLVSSVSNDKLHQIFEVFGEVKEIYGTLQKKFIEFYDIRSAEAAFYSLNGTDVAGKQIKLERGHVGVDFDSSSLAPMARMFSFDKPIGLEEPHLYSNGLKFGNQAIPNMHPHSLPEYHEGFANGNLYKASSTFVEMVGNGMKLNGGFNAAVHNGHPIGLSPGSFGSHGNGHNPHVNRHIWNNNNGNNSQSSPNQMMWPHSPASMNGIHTHRFPPVAAFPRAPPMLVKVASPVHHHIGSAPTMKPAPWDRRHAYLAESPEASSFHHGSPSHPMDAFARVTGNRLDLSSINVGPRSPHLFSGRNSLISVPASFDSPTERGRTFSHRRSELSSNNSDKKQFELDIDRIMRGEDNRTTLMIKNIPNKYTSKMLLAAIDEHCKGSYDFIYLPIDFKNKCNVGYAFINMIDPQKIILLHKAFDGKKWEKFNSEKVASLAYGRIQGKAALIAHFQNSSLMNEDKRCRPILFHTEGPNAGDQEPFPMGASVRSRPGKARAIGHEDGLNKPDPSHAAELSSKDFY